MTASAGEELAPAQAGGGACGAMFRGIKLVVFDLDGTLVDAFEDIADAANHIRAGNGLPNLTVDEVKEYVGYGARRLIEGILGTTDPERVESNHQRIVEYYSANPGKATRLYPGAAELLAALRQRGIRTAIASNKPHPVTSQVAQLMGISALLDYAVGEKPDVPRKPAADMLARIMQEAGVEPDGALMVGDTEVDIEFARNAGVRVVCVTYGQRSRAYLQELRPDAIVDSLPELLALISV